MVYTPFTTRLISAVLGTRVVLGRETEVTAHFFLPLKVLVSVWL